MRLASRPCPLSHSSSGPPPQPSSSQQPCAHRAAPGRRCHRARTNHRRSTAAHHHRRHRAAAATAKPPHVAHSERVTPAIAEQDWLLATQTPPPLHQPPQIYRHLLVVSYRPLPQSRMQPRPSGTRPQASAPATHAEKKPWAVAQALLKNQKRARPCRLGAKGSAQTRLRLALVSLRPRTPPHGSCWPRWPVAYALRAPQTSVSATLLR